jgi:hypothetical protein
MKSIERSGRFLLKLANDKHEDAYLQLPTFPVGKLTTSRSIRLHDLIGKYEGPDINIDFDEQGMLVGIEILT